MFRRAMSSKAKLDPRTFPRPPLCERTPRHLQVKWNDQIIADTREAYWLLETYHPPTYYLPPSSIKTPLQTTSKSSFCEWKGRATYYEVANPGTPNDVVKNRIWSYDNPTEGFKSIKGYLSFYAGPWDCYVDGEKIVPQPGNFYGGWTSSDIDQSWVKGAAGTTWW